MCQEVQHLSLCEIGHIANAYLSAFEKNIIHFCVLSFQRQQEEEPTPMRVQGFCRFLVFVGRQIVLDDDGAGFDLWHQHFAYVGGEGRAVHCTFDDPRSDQGVMGQPRNPRLRPPTAKRRIHGQFPAAQRSASQACEVGFDRCFVNKHNTFRPSPGYWPPMGKPIDALVPYLGAATFGRRQRLFLYVNPSRDNRSAMDEWCTFTPSASASASRSSKSVMSGSCAISSSKNERCGASLPCPRGRP